MNILKNNSIKVFLIIIIILHVFILSKLIFFPYPELFIYPYLTNHGLKPYAQILDQHFPGFLFLPINFDNLGMNNEIVARIWLIGIVITVQLLLFLIARSILKSGKKALLVNILYLVWQPFFEGWVLWIDNFLPLFLLPAAYFLKVRRFVLAGLFLGMGVVFKQTVIPLGLLTVIYIFWESRDFKIVREYILGLIFPISLMLLYLIYKGVFSDFWYWTVIFNLTIFAKSGTQIPTNFGFLSRVFVVYLASLSALFYKDRNLKIILFLFLAGSLAGAFDRANFVHFQPSLPFAVLLTSLGFYQLSKRKLAFVLIGLYFSTAIWWQNIFYKGHISSKVFFFDSETYAISDKIRQYTKEKDKIFVFGTAPHLYQMSRTLPAGDIFVFQFPWFLKVSENRILEGITYDKPEIVISDRSVKIDGQPITKFAEKIDQYIQENYHQIDNTGTTKILLRNTH